MNVAVIAVGGKLLERAEQLGVPFIQLPNTGIQPRCALGYSFRAMAKLLGREDALVESGRLAETLQSLAFQSRGQELAKGPERSCSSHLRFGAKFFHCVQLENQTE